jgi:hypothetical protein
MISLMVDGRDDNEVKRKLRCGYVWGAMVKNLSLTFQAVEKPTDKAHQEERISRQFLRSESEQILGQVDAYTGVGVGNHQNRSKTRAKTAYAG